MFATVLALAFSVSALAQVGTAQGTPYDVHVDTNVMVAMRDGVHLATDIYRPARNGVPVSEPMPVLFQRTPYNKSSIGRGDQVKAFVQSGYVVAVQDMRGRYKSEGLFVKYQDADAYDGFDAVEWLAKQPFSDGKVGMWGTSYGAHNQANAAKLKPKGLSALVLNFGGISNSWDQMIRWKGAFEQYQLVWAFTQIDGDAKDPVVKAMFKKEHVFDWLSAAPLRAGTSPLSVAPNFEKYYLELATQASAGHWKGLGVNWQDYYAQTADIPMLHIGGWYDLFTRVATDNYVALSKIKKSPMRLLIGPWDHGGNTKTHTGDVEFGPESAITDFATRFHLRWFDHFLKGRNTGVEREAPVRIFVMGTGDGHKDANGRLYHGGFWQDATTWPLPGTRFTNFYFQPDGGLRPERPVSGERSTTYTYDPAHPVPSIGGAYEFSVGGFDQRESERHVGSRPPYLPLRSRQDVVVFQTEPLLEDIEIAGPIVVKLFASSDRLDTDFTAKLVDVYPPSTDYPSGFDLNITDGILRARFRNSPDREELMTPGTVYEFTVEPFPTANVFKKGHRVRIDISSSNWPRFDANPNSGEPLGMNRQMMTAHNSIYHNGAQSSYVVLPIVPKNR